MNLLLWIVYLSFGVIIIAPLIQNDLFRIDKKYKNFQYVSISMLIWWILDFIKLVTHNATVIYYSSLLVYPIVYLFTLFLYIAIKKSLSSKIKKGVLFFLWSFFVIDLVICLTNSHHHWIKAINPADTLTPRLFDTAEYGSFFNIHTGFSYILLAITIFLIMRNVFRRLKESQDVFPFAFMVIAMIIGTSLNIVQVWVHKFTIDPTLVAITVFVSVLYYVFYIRDLKLILGLNRNRFILDHLREMYVVVSDTGEVVDASKAFITYFNLDLEEDMKYTDLLTIIKERAVLYQETEDVIEDYDPHKIYLHSIEKAIQLPFYKHSGTFYLFFDQTDSMHYVSDMNYIKTHDLMTKIYNRNYLEDLRNTLDDENLPYHVILFDLDGLKIFNDYLGHAEGDSLIKRFAKQLETVSNKDDVYPIRLGGDEFLILVRDKSIDFVNDMIKSLKALNKPLPFIEKVQYSYAIASSSENNDTLKKVLAIADKYMYVMKKGKGNYKSELKKAIELNQNK